MPEYGHLLTADLKFSAIQPLVNASSFLGAKYGEEEMTDAEAHARKQAEAVAADVVKQGGPAGVQEKQAIALIAYLQRVGTDLFRTEEPKKKDEPAAPAEGAPGEAPAEAPACGCCRNCACNSGTCNVCSKINYCRNKLGKNGMIKDLVSALDYSDCAEAALLLFVLSFGIMLYGCLRLSSQASERFASIPLSDEVEDPRHG